MAFRSMAPRENEVGDREHATPGEDEDNRPERTVQVDGIAPRNGFGKPERKLMHIVHEHK